MPANPQATALPNTLGETWQRVRSLAQGNSSLYGLWQRPYLVPFINQAYEEMTSQIKTATSKTLEAVINVLNIPPGTQSLGPWQAYDFLDPSQQNPQPTDGPLAGLYDPIRLWVKPAGALPQYFVPVRGPKDFLPNVNPPGLPVGTYGVILEWAWIGNVLLITPASAPIDIQVYGRCNPPRLVDDTDKLVIAKNMTHALAAATLAWSGIERSNTTIFQGAENRAIAGVDNIVADLTRQTQGNQRRPARMGRGGEGWCGYGWGTSSG